MEMDGVTTSIGAAATQPLSHLPIDILLGIFRWIGASSIDQCLLKQTSSRIKWVFNQQMKATTKIGPSIPFTHDLATIVRYLPTPDNTNDIGRLKLNCAKHGMLSNFKTLHTMNGIFNKSFLLASAHAGHLECTLALLVMTPPADRPAFRNEALQFACRGGHLDLVKCLIELGAEVHFNYDAAITNAAAAGHLNVVKYLHNHDLDIIFTQSNIPLRMACEHGHLPVVQYLCESGSNIIVLRHQPLFLACKNGHLEVAKYLWSLGAGNGPHFNVCHFITAACSEGHLEIVQFIYSLGLNVAAGDGQPIFEATKGGHVELVKYLISKGADRNGEAFNAACAGGNIELVRLLYSPDLSLDLIEQAFVLACSNGHLEAAQFISLLFIDGIPDVSRALVKASQNCHWDIVELLHSLGADIHVLNEYAFRSACRCGRLDMLKLIDPLGTNSLVRSGAALVLACQGDNLDVVAHIYSLMERDIQLSTLDSALFAAVHARRFPIIQFLHSVGANIYANDAVYLAMAVSTDDVELFKYLWAEIGNPQVYSTLNINVHQLSKKHNASKVAAYFSDAKSSTSAIEASDQ